MNDMISHVIIPAHEISMHGTQRTVIQTSVVKVAGLIARQVEDNLVTEEPLEIQLGFGPVGSRQRKSISVTMRTPGNDFELVAGFLMTEGVVRDANDIEKIAYAMHDDPGTKKNTETDIPLPEGATGNTVRVELVPDVSVSMANLERNFYTTSSCGICGKASLLALRTVCPLRVYNTFALDVSVLYRLPGRLRDAQGVFGQTGGLHGAGLFDANGDLLAAREDVGRHNAVDKLIGSEFLADRTPLRNSLLLLSGRASFELMQKALMGGVPMVASVGAPSSLAVKVAREFDITLIGFLRENQFNIYHGEKHIRGCISPSKGANQ
jgi:FdhD protein